ncbi:MAG: FABP family protein [Acidimicrobiales bacterium]|nr:FABP family protein [Acidimicrobiales bacterium]
MTSTLHPDMTPLADLVGTWKGTGSGSYPTIEDFEYLEELTFSHVGKPFMAMSQRTRHPTTSVPMHAETGYIRIPNSNTAELIVAHPTGLSEVGTGTVETGSLTIRSVVYATPSAKEVSAVEREIRWNESELIYNLSMAAVGQPMQHHLAAKLIRVTG